MTEWCRARANQASTIHRDFSAWNGEVCFLTFPQRTPPKLNSPKQGFLRKLSSILAFLSLALAAACAQVPWGRWGAQLCGASRWGLFPLGFPGAAVGNPGRPGGLRHQECVLPRFRGRWSEIKASGGRAPAGTSREGSFLPLLALGLQEHLACGRAPPNPHLHSHMAFLWVSPWCVSYKGTCHWI